MAIRVSSNYSIARYQVQLNNANEKEAKLMEQADGSKLHRPSDNSVDYSRYLRYDIADSENGQYQKNVQAGLSWMKSSASAMDGMIDLMKTFMERTQMAANDTNAAESADWQAIAGEMNAYIKQIVSLGNTQLGDRYIFSGQADLKQPFTISNNKVDRGLSKTLDDRQKAFFNDTTATSKMSQMLALTGDDGNTYYLNTKTGDIYTKQFVQEGYKDKIAAGQTTVDPANDRVGTTGGAVTVSNYFKNTGERKDPAVSPWSQSVTVNGNTINLSFATVKQNIVTYQGDLKYISMVKQNGSVEPTADTVNRTGADLFGNDIFDNGDSGNATSGVAMINNLLTIQAQTEGAKRGDWIGSDGITLVDVSHQTVLKANTDLGARNKLYTGMSSILTDQGDNITKDITDVSSTDVAALAVKLMQAKTIMSLSLSMGARILPMSLADYLS